MASRKLLGLAGRCYASPMPCYPKYEAVATSIVINFEQQRIHALAPGLVGKWICLIALILKAEAVYGNKLQL